MRKTLLSLSVGLVVSLAACAPAAPPAQGTPDDEVAIRGMAGKYSTAFNANDAAAMAQMVSEDFESIAADGSHTKGRAASQQMQETGIKDRKAAGLNLALNATTGYVRWIDASHAVAGGTYTMTGLPPGAPDKGAWMVAFTKGADGKWLMANSLVAEFMAPPPPPPADAKGEVK